MLSEINVGRVDSTENVALAARFEVNSIPSLFLYKDNKVWKYSGPLLTESVVAFVNSGYLKETPMPLWSSPMGPLGLAKGFLINIGLSIINLRQTIATALGVPEWVGFMVITGVVCTVILAVTFAGVYFTVAHSKND